MTATLYIIKDADDYRFGRPASVRLWEPECISRTWIRKVTVQLPDGFSVRENLYGEKLIFRDDQCYELSTDKDDAPVILDHENHCAYIHLTILEEGWNEA